MARRDRKATPKWASGARCGAQWSEEGCLTDPLCRLAQAVQARSILLSILASLEMEDTFRKRSVSATVVACQWAICLASLVDSVPCNEEQNQHSGTSIARDAGLMVKHGVRALTPYDCYRHYGVHSSQRPPGPTMIDLYALLFVERARQAVVVGAAMHILGSRLTKGQAERRGGRQAWTARQGRAK